MANFDDYKAKLNAIMAIPDQDVKNPSQPVDTFLQEAENLFKWTLDDAAQLNTVGISNEMLNDLPVRAGACREAQSVWNKDFRSQKEAQKLWGVKAPAAYDFREELLRAIRYAYRKDAVLLSRVTAISKGDGHADMIQDLNDIAVLGKENNDLLNAIGFDTAKLDTAANMADELAELLAEANGDKAEQNESKVIRDKAYMHLKELVDEVRAAGKYVFHKDKTRYKGYTSSYWKNKKRTNNSLVELQ
ncbi:MAG: hypothetical protein ABFR62_13340 [Bacteroidota bacterium]